MVGYNLKEKEKERVHWLEEFTKSTATPLDLTSPRTLSVLFVSVSKLLDGLGLAHQRIDELEKLCYRGGPEPVEYMQDPLAIADRTDDILRDANDHGDLI